MIRPLTSHYQGAYYDGEVPVRRPAAIELGDQSLRFAVADGEPRTLAYHELRFAAQGLYREPVRLEFGAAEALLVEDADFLEALRQHGGAPPAPALDLSSWPAVMMSLIGIAALAAALYTFGTRAAAEVAVRVLPVQAEDRLGKAIATVLAPEETRCRGPEVTKLQPLIDRLARASGSPLRFQVTYVNQSLVNAFAAPGGYVVVYRGLLDEAESAEEFAGVLAHEMQHVLLRHSARAIAREFSGRALLSLMAIDSSGTPAAAQAGAMLAGLSFQRSDEDEADRAAVALLDRAGVGAAGLARFFRRLQLSPKVAEPARYLSTHPALLDRIATIEKQIRPPAGPPLMSEAEWKSARRVCAGPGR